MRSSKRGDSKRVESITRAIDDKCPIPCTCNTIGFCPIHMMLEESVFNVVFLETTDFNTCYRMARKVSVKAYTRHRA